MALLETVFRISRKGQIGLLRIDARIKEEHKRASKVSTSVTEMGGNASNNVMLEPRAITMEGFISDTPVSPLGLRAIEDKVYDLTSLIPGATGTGVPGGESRSPLDAWKYLELLWLERTRFSIISRLGIYKDMIMTSLTSPQTRDIGRSLSFTAVMREARSPGGTGRRGASAKGNVKDSATEKSKDGNITEQEPTENKKKKARSILAAFF